MYDAALTPSSRELRGFGELALRQERGRDQISIYDVTLVLAKPHELGFCSQRSRLGLLALSK